VRTNAGERLDRPAVDVTIIIAVRNNGRDLDACLPSISEGTSARREIIIVDNGSTDGAPERLREAYANVRVIANPVNLGHCRAINQGLAVTAGEFVLVLDADTVVWPGAIDCLVAFLRSRPDAAIVAPRLLNPDGTIQETARAFPRPINALFGRQTLLTKLFPRNRFSVAYLRRRDAAAVSPFEVEWVSAACMLFRRSLVDRIGKWDEGFAGYWVDADWCRRAQPAGRVYCEPRAQVSHLEQHRMGRKKDPARIVQFHRGVNRFYRKHYTFGWADPRALVTSAALAGRGAVLILANALRRAHSTPIIAPGAQDRRTSTRFVGGPVLSGEREES